jgi:hypothetical protein
VPTPNRIGHSSPYSFDLRAGGGCVYPRFLTRGSFFNSPCQRPPIFMTEQPPIVFVVDDDASVRDALKSLIRSVGLRVELFGSSREFLQRQRPDCAELPDT